jgi:beta-glucanase (GH16 family)
MSVAVAGLVVALVSIGSSAASSKPKAATPSQRTTVSFLSASGPPAGYHLVFNDTFTASGKGLSELDTCYPWADTPKGCTNFGNYQELEWYLPTQVLVSRNSLFLEDLQTPTAGTTRSGSPQQYEYRSGMVTTYSSFHFTYGYVQFQARLPSAPASTWSAFWMLPYSQKSLPEIDIMENWGTDPDILNQVIHRPDGTESFVIPTVPHLTAGWHTFAVNWEPRSITWYVDGRPTLAVSSGIPHQPMYLLANLAITSMAPACPVQNTSACTGLFQIRSIKVWKRSS